MLSVHNVHSNAATIHSVGVDRKMRSNGICFELSDEGEQRSTNLMKNRALIARSKGLLAEINGRERYLSVGCGHTAASVKLAKVGGRTIEPSLQDSVGNVDNGKLLTDPEFSALLDEGWEWVMIDASVDVKFRNFANVMQKALHVNNHSLRKLPN